MMGKFLKEKNYGSVSSVSREEMLLQGKEWMGEAIND